MTSDLSERAKALLLSFVLLFAFLGVWEFAIPNAKNAGKLSEYELLTGGGSPQARVPPPSQVIEKAVQELSQPFYDKGPNDKGICLRVAWSAHSFHKAGDRSHDGLLPQEIGRNLVPADVNSHAGYEIGLVPGIAVLESPAGT